MSYQLQLSSRVPRSMDLSCSISGIMCTKELALIIKYQNPAVLSFANSSIFLLEAGRDYYLLYLILFGFITFFFRRAGHCFDSWSRSVYMYHTCVCWLCLHQTVSINQTGIATYIPFICCICNYMSLYQYEYTVSVILNLSSRIHESTLPSSSVVQK